MIIGIGSDLCDIRRIAQSYQRWGQRFLDKIFTEAEAAKALRRRDVAGTLAKRFAAKEACAKALGTGLSHGVFWRDMEVVNLPSGAPTMRLSAGAQAQLLRLLPPQHSAVIHVSLTDEAPYAQAFVIIEARIETCSADINRL